jgi:hypothetical protein
MWAIPHLEKCDLASTWCNGDSSEILPRTCLGYPYGQEQVVLAIEGLLRHLGITSLTGRLLAERFEESLFALTGLTYGMGGQHCDLSLDD